MRFDTERERAVGGRPARGRAVVGGSSPRGSPWPHVRRHRCRRRGPAGSGIASTGRVLCVRSSRPDTSEPMSEDDDVSRRILEGDAYERAVVTVRQTFPISLEWKVRIALVALAAAGVIAPALFVRREYVSTVTDAETLSATLSPTVVTLAFVGVVVTFAAGSMLVRQQYLLGHQSLSETRARRLVRVENAVMWFVFQGSALIAIPVAVSLLVVLSRNAVDALYEAGVVAFGPAGAAGVDARLVSGLGIVLAVTLYAASVRVRRVS